MRGLTEKEKQRKESFDKICEKMKADGYEEKDLTVGVVEANVVGVLLPLPFAALACIVYFHANSFRAADIISGIWKIPNLSQETGDGSDTRDYMGSFCPKSFSLHRFRRDLENDHALLYLFRAAEEVAVYNRRRNADTDPGMRTHCCSSGLQFVPAAYPCRDHDLWRRRRYLHYIKDVDVRTGSGGCCIL